MAEAFRFYTRLNLVELLGRRASNVRELYVGIRQVPDSSIYYHTHRFLQQHLCLSPEPPNDFAFWVSHTLGLDHLAEQLAAVDTIRCCRITELRDRFVDILEGCLRSGNTRIVDGPEGEEFHFMSCRTFILPTPYQAESLADFLSVLPKLSIDSLYFHVFESRLRLERGDNDFSRWFRSLGKTRLADAISRLDPYTMTLESLRRRILDLVKHDG